MVATLGSQSKSAGKSWTRSSKTAHLALQKLVLTYMIANVN